MNPSTVQQRLTTALTRAATFGLLALAAVFYSAHDARAQWTTNGTNINNTNTGNVGIGTTSPSALLDLRVDSGDVVQRFSNAGGATGALEMRYKFEAQQHRMGWTDGIGNWLFYTQYAPSNANSVGFFPGRVGVGTDAPSVKLSIGGAGANVYATDAWVENNAHVQGNESLTQGGRGRMRLGTAWGYMGLYAENSSTGTTNDLVFGSSSGVVRVGPGNVPQSFIVPNGNVGIGTTSPATLLNLRVDSGDVVQRFSNAGGIGGALDLRYRYEAQQHRMGLSDGNGNWLFYTQFAPSNANSVGFFPGRVGIGTTTPTAALDVAGNITVSGNINAKYQDVAEWVPSKQKLNAGTVVILDTANRNHVTASATAYDTRVAGVVSAQPGIALGEAGEGKALVATTGRVKVRVDATKAPIGVGDLLVTGDAPGVAMKSQPVELGGVSIHRPGTIIGKALEPLDKGTGEILVLLSLQ